MKHERLKKYSHTQGFHKYKNIAVEQSLIKFNTETILNKKDI